MRLKKKLYNSCKKPDILVKTYKCIVQHQRDPQLTKTYAISKLGTS